MSIADEINRINEQKNIIRDKLRDMGLVGSTESPNINGLAETIKNDIIIATGSTVRDVLEGDSITIARGFYKAPVTVRGITNETADKQKIMPFLNPITPTKSWQSYTVPEGYYGFGSFSIQPIGNEYKDTSDADVTEEQVLANKVFYNSTGRLVGKMSNIGTVDVVLDTSYGVELGGSDAGYLNNEFKIPKGYHDGTGSVRIIVEEKEVTPTELPQTVVGTPAVATQPGKVLGAVKVKPIPSQYKDITNQLLEPSQVLKGGRYINKTTGELTYGTIENLGEVRGSINTYSETEYSLESGGHFDAIYVTLDNSDLIAELQKI